MRRKETALPGRLGVVLLLGAVLLALALLMSGCASDGGFSAEQPVIRSVRIDKRKSKVQLKIWLTKDYVNANRGKNLYLFEVLPHQRNMPLGGLEPVEILKAKEEISVELDFAVQNRTRRCSAFVVAEKSAAGEFIPVTAPKYIENPEILAKAAYDYPRQSSKKGLIYDNLADLQALGAAHTVITVDMAKFLRTSGGQGAVSYLYNGVNYYLDKEKLSYLDYEIKVCTDAGVHVFLNIVLGPPAVAAEEPLISLYYDTAIEPAAHYAVNVDNDVSVALFQGFVNFLSERYTRASREYGFAGSYIIGYEINDNRHSNYAGEMEPAAYADAYLALLRMADAVVRSNYAGGRVYLSLGNNFSSPVKDPDQSPNPKLDYAAEEILSLIAEGAGAAGDFPWHVSVNPYPSDRGQTEIWRDLSAESTFNTPFVTMRNLTVLTDFLAQEAFLYQGNPRSVIIGEFAVSADPGDPEALKKQAAAYAYAYYTAQSSDYIDAFIYKRQSDSAEDGDLHFGLFDPADTVQKPIAALFAQIDLESDANPADFALPIIGVTGWESVIQNYQTPAPARVVVRDSPVLPESKKYKKPNEVLYDFTQGTLHNFYPSDNADYVELRGDTQHPSVMYAKLSDKGQLGRMGISRAYLQPLALKKVKSVTVKFKIDKSDGLAEDGTATFTLLMKREGAPDYVFEGNAVVTCGEWVDLTFPVSGYLKKTDAHIDGLWLLVSGEGAGGEYGLWVETIAVHRGAGLWWLVVILAAAVLLAGAALLWLYFRRARPYLPVGTIYMGGVSSARKPSYYPPNSRGHGPRRPKPAAQGEIRRKLRPEKREMPGRPTSAGKAQAKKPPARAPKGQRAQRKNPFSLGDDE